jgi:hypothetical protein
MTMLARRYTGAPNIRLARSPNARLYYETARIFGERQMTERIEFLRNQATAFRRFAKSRGGKNGIKQQLIELADQCEQIAAGIEQEISRGDESS